MALPDEDITGNTGKNHLFWEYITTAKNNMQCACRIVVTVIDLPGNAATEELYVHASAMIKAEAVPGSWEANKCTTAFELQVMNEPVLPSSVANNCGVAFCE